MKLALYDVINDPMAKLITLREFEVNKKDFEEDKTIVNLLNKHLKYDKLSSEQIYALGLTYGLIPKGLIQIGLGNDFECSVNKKLLAIGLLLMGAESFMVFHNHPGGNKNISIQDKKLSYELNEVGNSIGIGFIRHLMVTKGYFAECEKISPEEIEFNQGLFM